MRSKAGMKFDCIFEEPLDFIDIDYTHLNKTIRYEQRLHGKWIEINSTDLKCSICGHRELKERTLVTSLDYCSLCGAKMGGDEK